MPAPTIEKTWSGSQINQNVAASATHIRDALLAIVNSLIAQGWTVAGSCNSAAAGMDAVNRWAASTNLVWATGGGARSWIVLANSALGANAQIAIELDPGGSGSSAYYTAKIWMSTAGFTGGSTTARPTATDEQQINTLTTTHWTSPYSTASNLRWHVWVSSDKKCTRIAACCNGYVGTFVVIDAIKNPRSGMTNTWFATWLSTATTTANVSTIANLANNQYVRARPLTTNTVGSMTCESAGTQGSICALQGSPDDFGGYLPLSALGLFGFTAGGRGPLGRVFDLWFGSTTLATADSYDETGNQVLGQLRDVVLPSLGQVLLAA